MKISPGIIATFVARSATSPQSVGQETECQTKVRVELRMRMCHLREKASQSGKDIPKVKARAKASGNLKTEKGFRAVDPPTPWSLRRSLGKRPAIQSKNNGGILGLAPLGALMVGGTEFELNSFKTASGEILLDEGQLMWPCFLQDGRKCGLRGHVTDVHKPLISAGKVLGKDTRWLSCIPVEVRSSLGTHPPET